MLIKKINGINLMQHVNNQFSAKVLHIFILLIFIDRHTPNIMLWGIATYNFLHSWIKNWKVCHCATLVSITDNFIASAYKYLSIWKYSTLYKDTLGMIVNEFSIVIHIWMVDILFMNCRAIKDNTLYCFK